MNAVIVSLLAGGAFFLAISTLGLIRLPDFYTRAHAAGKAETLGAILILGGLALHVGAATAGVAAGFKIFLILVLVAIANPTGIHILTRAAKRSGLELWTREREGAEP